MKRDSVVVRPLAKNKQYEEYEGLVCNMLPFTLRIHIRYTHGLRLRLWLFRHILRFAAWIATIGDVVFELEETE